MINFTDSQSIDRALSHALQNGIEHITNGTVTVAIREFGMVKGVMSVMLSKDRNDAIVGYGTACAMLREWMAPAADPIVAPQQLPAAPVIERNPPSFKGVQRTIIMKGQKANKELSKRHPTKWVAYRHVEISYPDMDGDLGDMEKEYVQWSKLTPAMLRRMADQTPAGRMMSVYVGFDVYDSFSDYLSQNTCGYDPDVDGFDFEIPVELTCQK